MSLAIFIKLTASVRSAAEAETIASWPSLLARVRSCEAQTGQQSKLILTRPKRQTGGFAEPCCDTLAEAWMGVQPRSNGRALSGISVRAGSGADANGQLM